jgi:oligosaccharide repeat unit polymerase
VKRLSLLPAMPDKIRNLASTPSAYGLITWVLGFLTYYYGPIPWNRPTPDLWVVFSVVTICFLLSLLVSISILNRPDYSPRGWWVVQNDRRVGFYLIAVLHLIGLTGIAKYIVDFGRSMGDIFQFKQAFLYESYLIRREAEATSSYGFQISYFGWIAIGLSLLYKSSNVWKSRTLLLLSLLQLVANVSFIDRTRPTWIIFTGLLLVVLTSRSLTISRLLGVATMIPVLLIALFVSIGSWIGKTDFNEAFKGDNRFSILEGPIYYVSCGFAYLNWASLNVDSSTDFGQRTFYPVYRVWEIFDKSKRPPSQINDFVDVPLPTNVGTLAEPFIRDGGLLFVLVGALTHSFLFDIMATILRRQRSALGLYLLTNLCFINFIGFFTPKLNSFPVWFLFGSWILLSALKIFDPDRIRY